MNRFLHRRPGSKAPSYKFPDTEYNREPMVFYWYALDASQMPLMQFLSYYQSIEYYFPVYSESEAKRRAANVLKNPTFRADRETDLSRLVSAIRPYSGRGYDSGKSQLESTLKACISRNEVEDFAREKRTMREFFIADRSVNPDYSRRAVRWLVSVD